MAAPTSSAESAGHWGRCFRFNCLKRIVRKGEWAVECTVYGVLRYWISVIVITASALAITPARSRNPDLSRAEELYRRTEYGRAIEALQALDGRDAAGYALLGKSYFMQGQYKESCLSGPR
jgi:hypothetical protein